MDYQLKTVPIGVGANFNSIQDKKFKHNRITVSFILPLQEDTVTEYALLSYLFRQGGEEFPDFIQLNRKLAALYGAGFSADVSKYGAYQVIDLTIQGIDNRFALQQENIIEECSRLLCSIIMKPLMGTKFLTSKILENEKQSLEDTILTNINDKRFYALTRCKEIMCHASAIAIPRYGYFSKVTEIDVQKVAEAYKKVLKTAAIEIMYVGYGDPQSAVDTFQQALANTERMPVPFTSAVTSLGEMEKEKYQEEQMEIVQSKLVMGFRTGRLEEEKMLSAMRLLVALYGGTVSSKLFKNVRERLSLCYYCAARLDKLTGIMMVDCGVESANKEIAQQEICNQLEECRKGNITEEEIKEAKLALKNSLGSVKDSMSSMEDWYLSQIMCATKIEPQEEIDRLESVQREDLIVAAKQITLDTTYFLTPKVALL